MNSARFLCKIFSCMSLFAKRKTILQNMSFMAIMAAINIIVSVISAFSPIASVILVIFLPLTSTLVELFCEDKYYPIYALTTFGLGIVATLWNMQTTFFTLLPSLITGYVFGLFAKRKFHPVWSVLASALLQALVTILFIPLINFIFNVDIIYTFKKAFNLAESASINIIIPAFILAISFIQIVLSYIVVSQEIKKFGEEMSKDETNYFIYGLVGSIISLAIIGLYFASLTMAYVFLILSIYFAAFIVVSFIYDKMWHTLIVSGVFVLLNIFIFSLAYANLKDYSGLLLVGITPFALSSLSLVVSFLKKKPD